MHTDVLVVGAGPTGLMLANQLQRRGVRVMVIDRHPGPAVETRALAVHARTLEIYSKLGIVKAAIDLGKRATGANLWSEGRKTARIPLGDIGRDLSPYPFVLILGQDDNERLLGDALHAAGSSVRWNTELVDFDQHDDRVVAKLKRADGSTEQIDVGWLAGCDGAHSIVRKRCGIAFEGAAYEDVFFVADVEVSGELVRDELNVCLWREGFDLFFPMRGRDHWRLVGILPERLRNRNDVKFEDVIDSVQSRAALALEFKACSWFSTYRIHRRRASRFRDRRAFVLGDAAHIHSPVGAQGMNTGLQDAYNLAWKLALVVAGRADARLLDSYDAERGPVATRLLETTDRAFSLVVADGWLAGLVRAKLIARIAAFAMSLDVVRRTAFRTISQIGIAYRAGPLSETLPRLPHGAPQAGDRFPWLRLRCQAGGPVVDLFEALDDTRLTLIAVGQRVPTGSLPVDLTCIHVDPRDADNDRELTRAGIPQTSFYLLRPDGHVGLAGTRVDAATLGDYLSKRLHLGPIRQA